LPVALRLSLQPDTEELTLFPSRFNMKTFVVSSPKK